MTSDPLQNPRHPWQLNYDHRTRVGRYAKWLAKVLRMRTSGDRYLDELKARFK